MDKAGRSILWICPSTPVKLLTKKMQNQNSVKLASAKWEIIPKCEKGKISADSKCKVFEKKKMQLLTDSNVKWLALPFIMGND